MARCCDRTSSRRTVRRVVGAIEEVGDPLPDVADQVLDAVGAGAGGAAADGQGPLAAVEDDAGCSRPCRSPTGRGGRRCRERRAPTRLRWGGRRRASGKRRRPGPMGRRRRGASSTDRVAWRARCRRKAATQRAKSAWVVSYLSMAKAATVTLCSGPSSPARPIVKVAAGMRIMLAATGGGGGGGGSGRGGGGGAATVAQDGAGGTLRRAGAAAVPGLAGPAAVDGDRRGSARGGSREARSCRRRGWR